MTDNDSITASKNLEIQKFNLSETHPAIIDAHDDQISIVQFWRVLAEAALVGCDQRGRWF